MTADRPRVELEGEAIRFAGTFNPVIFQPAWYAAQGLLRNEEAENAKVDVIHPDVTSFSTSWLELEVTREWFYATATDLASHELLRDFVAGTFRLLEHTLVSRLDMAHFTHYALLEGYAEKLGDVLVPTGPWEFLQNPMLARVAVGGERDDGRVGNVQVIVEPSQRVKGGLFVLVADEFELEEGGKPTPAGKAVQLLSDSWDDSTGRADMIRNQLISLA
jgi:hypothetical protein